MHLHLRITPNDSGQAVLDKLFASVEIKETLAERFEYHIAAALRDVVFDVLP
jgi:hypothetical protein